MEDTAEALSPIETPAEALDKLTAAQIFTVDFNRVVGKKDNGKPLTLQERIESTKGKLAAHTDLAACNITPAYLTEGLWPSQQLGDTRVKLDGLRVLDHLWWVLTPEAQKILGTAGISQEVMRVESDFYDMEAVKEESARVLEAVATLGHVELHFQEIEDARAATLRQYWEPLIVLLSKMGVDSFSLHTPYLENINLDPGEEMARFNLRTMLLTGFIPETEVDRLKAGLVDRYLQINNRIGKEDLSAEERVELIEEMMTDWLPEERAKRAKAAFMAVEQQMQWFKQIKEDRGLAGGKMVIHFCSVGEQHHLSKEEFELGVQSLERLQEIGGEDIELLVETQGLSPEQLKQLFSRLPNQKVVFDVAHVLIESGRYGNLKEALGEYCDRIGMIHFSQPLEKNGRLVDEHLAPHEPGVLTENQEKMILDFAAQRKIWVTFESGFGTKDLDKVLKWYGEETTVSD